MAWEKNKYCSVIHRYKSIDWKTRVFSPILFCLTVWETDLLSGPPLKLPPQFPVHPYPQKTRPKKPTHPPVHSHASVFCVDIWHCIYNELFTFPLSGSPLKLFPSTYRLTTKTLPNTHCPIHSYVSLFCVDI